MTPAQLQVRAFQVLLCVLAVSLFVGCEVNAPGGDDCKEFDWKTTRNGVQTTCRMLWCENGIGAEGLHASGLAALWCGEAAEMTKGAGR